MFPWIVIGLLIIIILLSYILKWQRGRNLSQLPTYTFLPIVGTIYKMLGGGKALHNQVEEFSKIMDETNLPFLHWAGSQPMIVLQDPIDLRLVTNACAEKPYIYDFGKIWVGDGLATAPGHMWKYDIKGFAKALKRKSVKTYQDVFNAQAKKLVDKLSIGPSDVPSEIAYTTFEAICIVCTGDEIPDLVPIDEYHESVSVIFERSINRVLNIFSHPELVFRCTKAYRELKKHVDVMHRVSEAILKRYQMNLATRKNDSQNGDRKETHKPRFKPFLSHLKDIRMSEEKIKSEIDTLIFAQEPVATALLMVLLVIGTRQDVQKKLYKEIKEIFGDSKRDVTKEDLERMVYCEGVIREALRLYPPAPLVIRYIDRAFKIKSCTIPKDSLCLINIWGSGRSKRIWGPDVLEFRPERWIEPASPLPPILAFSMGKRGCVGEKYAYPILKTMIAHIVRELKFEADITKLKVKVDLLLRVYQGLDTLKIYKKDAERDEKIKEVQDFKG